MNCYEIKKTMYLQICISKNISKKDKMKQYIFLIIGVFSLFQANAQLEFGTHFMSNIAQSNWTNPAAFNDYKINVTLPSIYAGVYNSAIRPNQVLEKRENDLYLDMDGLLNKIGDDGLNLQTNVNVETFSFAFQAKKFQVSLSHGLRVNMNHLFPKEMLQFAWGGNAQFVGETINIAPKLNFMAYQEFGLGLGIKVSKQLTLGAKLKYLVGAATYSTSNAKANIYTDPEYFQLTADTDYLIQTGGLPESDVNDGEFFNFDDFEPTIFGNNKGVAIDFGASFDVNEKLNIQTSVLNIGKINWEDDVYNYHSQGEFTFEGLDFKPILDEGEFSEQEIIDTLDSTFDFETTSNSFSTVLPSSFYLSGTYKVRPRLSVGALLYAQGFQSELTTAFALNVKKDFGNIFSVGAQYAMVEGGVHNVGVSSTLKLGPVQIFAMTDNLAPIFNPLKGQNMNFRVGMNLAFKRMKKDEPKETLEDIEIPNESVLEKK